MFRPGDTKKDKSKNEQHLHRNLVFSASTVVFAVLVLIFYVISNLTALSSFLGKVLSILAPVIGGAALAYLCNPILNFLEKYLLRRIRSHDLKRMLSIFLTYLIIILAIAAIGLLIIPQLISSVKALIAQYENYIANAITNLNAFITNISQKLPFDIPEEVLADFFSLEKLNALLETLLGNVDDLFNTLLANIQSYGAKLFTFLSNTILALFISFYLLATKETRLAQVKKLCTALFSEKHNQFITKTAGLAHNAFGGYLGGKFLDALMVGIVYFIIFSIFRIPYAAMLATIMGVMNILPFFGPLIGAVPSCFIVLISDPSKLILFVILVLVVGQIDANIIEPKILGDRTGVSSLCVIVAISVMSNLWGLAGMIFAVPLFAVVVTLIDDFANEKLSKKGLSGNLDDYYDDDDDFTYEQEAKVRLSPQYYLDRVRFMFTRKAKRGAKPCREDYLIYPPEWQQDEETSEDAPDESETWESDDIALDDALEDVIASDEPSPEEPLSQEPTTLTESDTEDEATMDDVDEQEVLEEPASAPSDFEEPCPSEDA
jgi:predicted PurR-regulated permease PerM